MPEEGFLRRWARVKASAPEAVAQAPAPAPAAPPAPLPAAAPAAGAGQPVEPAHAEAAPAPTLEDAAQLTPQSDFSAFVGQGVDKDVRRLALKKLFADPHFNVMDRLDMYMDDYNKPSPMSAAMLAGLQHARSALRRPEEVQEEIARLTALEKPAGGAPSAPVVAEEPTAAAGEEEALAGTGDPGGSTDAASDETGQDSAARQAPVDGAQGGDTSLAGQPPHAGDAPEDAVAPAAAQKAAVRP